MASAGKLKPQSADDSPFGYVSLLGLRMFDLPHLLRDVERGLPYKSLEHFVRSVPLTSAEVHDLLQIAPRTLARRKEEGRLSAEESDRLMRVARLMAKTIDLFDGNMPRAAQWLRTPQVGFGGAMALDLARTELGAREVDALVDRLAYGVFS